MVGKHATVTVRSFNRRPVKDEDGEQQTYRAPDQHVLESGSFEIVLIDEVSRKGAKQNRAR